jgi:manganese/zinc/iron transport system permease protein
MTLALLDPANLWVMAVATCCCVACGTIGSFLVLRRMSLLGDAISHSILPGLALAFIITGTRSPAAMLVGALAVGLLTAAMTSGVRRLGRIPEDAALGVVFSSLFAVGVLLITWVANSVDLDPSCVLYGLLEDVWLDMVPLATRSIETPTGPASQVLVEVPRALLWQSGLMLANIALIIMLFKELRLTSFDPGLATSLGINAAVVRFILLTAVTTTTVVSFEAVGSILVVAMLVAPGATAQLFTDRLDRMVLLSGAFGAAAAILGCLAAIHFNASSAGMIATVAGAQFLLAALVAPRYGVLARFIRRARLSLRIAREDVLGLLYRLHESADSPSLRAIPAEQVHRSVSTPLRARIASAQLRRRGLIERSDANELALTTRGVESAAKIIRAHRLWETYLAKNIPLPLDHLHEPSERIEHFLSGEIQERIAAEVGQKPDPHGKSIPGI